VANRIGNKGRRGRRRRAATTLLAGTLLLLAASTAAAALHHALERPDRPAPPVITFGPTVGGSPDWSPFRYGVSGSILFRPDAAASIFNPLFYWNTGLVLHGEYRDIAPDRNILTFDVVLRRYLVDPSRRGRGAGRFAGAGGGVALAGYPYTVAADEDEGGETETTTPPDVQRAEDSYYSFLAELGYERDLAGGLVVVWKAQWRSYIWSARDFSNWTVHVQFGVPLPW